MKQLNFDFPKTPLQEIFEAVRSAQKMMKKNDKIEAVRIVDVFLVKNIGVVFK